MPGMGKRRYSDDEKANALAALAANGGNVSQTAEQLDIPRQTLTKWANGHVHPSVPQKGQQKKKDMADALESVAWKLLRSIPKKIDKAPLNQTATAMGIAIDKARLLRGKPTQITQHDLSSLSDDDLDAELAAAERAVAQAAPGEAAAAGGASEGGDEGQV